jgi:uncharacterized protein YndB with AHSA1/START domain
MRARAARVTGKGVKHVATFAKEITIKTRPQQVFEFFKEPEHLPEIWPSMIEVTNVETLENGGYRYHWMYKMAGKKFTGTTTTEKFVPFERIVEHSDSEFDSTFDWKFTPYDGGTKVELFADYKLPKTLLGTFSEPFLAKLNEREADLVLTNLKARIEF